MKIEVKPFSIVSFNSLPALTVFRHTKSGEEYVKLYDREKLYMYSSTGSSPCMSLSNGLLTGFSGDFTSFEVIGKLHIAL